MRQSAKFVIALLAGLVAAQDCVDEHDACASWAGSGECDKNKGFMSAACAKSCNTCAKPIDPKLTEVGPDRVTLDIAGYGKITLGFYPNAAPVTVAHIVNLFRMGCYDTNHVFRVDKGFVAQVQSVYQQAVTKPLSDECAEEAKKTVPGEFTPVPHTRGTLSMGRMSDPDSGGSSFSMLLGRAAHLDNEYTVFGKVLEGDDVLSKLEGVETKREGIFVMPKQRIEISTGKWSRVKSTPVEEEDEDEAHRVEL
jgi:cyclophilin family peptidyl-prolyl cis-trans isomerase